jgi:hypothetical protein
MQLESAIIDFIETLIRQPIFEADEPSLSRSTKVSAATENALLGEAIGGGAFSHT